jgi:NitT/TauT family transport system permease protein
MREDRVAAALVRAEAAVRVARWRSRAIVWGGRLALFALLIGGWEFGAGRLFDSSLTSQPSAIVSAWWQLSSSGVLWPNARITLTEMISGYLIGAALGIVVAGFLSLSVFAYRLSEPVLLVLYGIPTVALSPLLVAWFGLGLTAKIVLAGKATFILVVLNTVAGALAADQRTLSALRVLGANRLDLFRIFILPSALPYTLTALRVAIPVAMLGTILGELLGSNASLGYMLDDQATSLAIPQMFATIATVTLCVFAVRLVLMPLDAIMTKLYPQR